MSEDISDSRTIGPRSAASLDEAAKLHLRHSNISFKIISAIPGELIVQTQQGKHMSENYAGTERLVSLTKDLFGKFVNDNTEVKVYPTPYQQAIVDIVNPEWITGKLLSTGTRIKDIQHDTGIDKTNLSAWINGTRPMSQPVKAMFFYYFATKDQNYENDTRI